MADIFGVSTDTWVRIALGAVTLVGIPATYYFGIRQKIAAEREKARMDSANAKIAAEAAEAKSEADLTSAVLTGGKETFKILVDGINNYQEIYKKVAAQGEEMALWKADTAKQIGDLRLKYEGEINKLRLEVVTLEGQVALLRQEIEMKDSALADCAKVRERCALLERKNAELTNKNEELERANSAFLYLWEAASNGNADAGTVNIAEAAIKRVLESANKEGGKRDFKPMSEQEAASFVVAEAIHERDTGSSDTGNLDAPHNETERFVQEEP